MVDGAGSSIHGITCPACGAALAMRAPGYTVTLVCEYCGSFLDTANPDVRLIARLEEEQQKLEIPLGTRGILRGVEWQAIGYMRRFSNGPTWEEYLLFNPYHGYRWLVGADGSWSFGTMLTANPDAGGTARWQGRTYRLFYGRAKTQVDYVVGEFYWRVHVGETVITMDYVRPGAMLSMEENAAERSWTLNEYLPPGEIKAVFPGVTARGWRLGDTPAPHEPSPFARQFGPWRNIALSAAAVLLVSHCTVGPLGLVGRADLSVVIDKPTVTRSVGPIQLTSPWQGMTVDTSTPAIDQGWTDIDIAFVDRRTQERYEVYSLNEHYYGYDSDGSWSEGNREQTVKVGGVPAGTYDLIVEASAHTWSNTGYNRSGTPVGVTVSVYRGAVFYGNLMLALVLVLLPFLVLWWLQYMFDKARLAEMDHAPAPADWSRGRGTE